MGLKSFHKNLIEYSLEIIVWFLYLMAKPS